MKKLIALAFVILLTGCAGTKFHTRMMENQNQIRYEQVDNQNYDYKVTMQNVFDYGMDLDNREDRMKQLTLVLGDECKNIQVVSERQINRGKVFEISRQAIDYVMNVKCYN